MSEMTVGGMTVLHGVLSPDSNIQQQQHLQRPLSCLYDCCFCWMLLLSTQGTAPCPAWHEHVGACRSFMQLSEAGQGQQADKQRSTTPPRRAR